MKYLMTSIALLGVLMGATRVVADEVSPETLRAARAVAVTTCSTCHGPQGRSIVPKFPRLAGQTAQYLLKQLHAFHSNTRDVAVMHGVTTGLSADNMSDVAAYLASLGP